MERISLLETQIAKKVNDQFEQKTQPKRVGVNVEIQLFAVKTDSY